MLLALSVISSQGASLGPTAYKVFDERGGSIGRIHSNDWVLPDPAKLVSSHHANVRYAGGAFFLEDASTNGTFLNGLDRPIPRASPARLADGDRILIGDYEILVQLIDNSPVAAGSASTAATGASAARPFAEPAAQPFAAQMPQPPQPPHAPTPPAPQPVVPPELAAKLTGEPRDLLLLLGLDPDRVDPGVYQQLGTILRTVVQGLIDVLSSRAEVKSHFRMPMTNIRPVENNPLKFSLNAEDALHNLFVKRNPGYLPAIESFREGFQDIAFHQMAMLAGVRAAFNAMLASFHPDKLETLFERKLRRTALFRFANRLRYWSLYRDQFEDIEKNPETHFQLLFGEEFARAYDEQLQRLTAEARRGIR